jgi:similar to stage IV sporulation protein
MSEEEVVAELLACGLGVGSYIPNISAPQLENRVLMASERISWISIRMDGTVAVVQVIEQIPPSEAEEGHGPANLIAATDGQIEYLQLYRGNPVVVVGQAVRKGELLVSGIYDSNRYGYRYTRAAGQVMARTKREIVVEIPLEYTKKHCGAPFVGEKYLHFFNFSVKISKNSRNQVGTCDIIKEKKRVEAPGLYRLPLYWEIVTITPYELQMATRTHEEALELAYAELDLRLSALSEGAQILEKGITTELLENSLRLVCSISCIENIAEQSEFEITDVS